MHAATRALSDTVLSQVLLASDGSRATWRAFLEDAAAPERDGPAAALSRALAACPFEACFFEARPVARADVDTPLEWVLVESPALTRADPDPRPFAEHGVEGPPGADQPDVLSFDNLGRDARLVVPRRRAAAEVYGHLASFVRGAPADQVGRLWSVVGSELSARLARSPAPVWLGTSGLGVAWVHVRLDERPKYVTHAPYRSYPAAPTG